MNLFTALTGRATTGCVCVIDSISLGTYQQDSVSGILTKKGAVKVWFMMGNRESQIYDHAYDIGLIWAYEPYLRLGQIMKGMVDRYEGIEYKSDPEVIDLLREYIKGE